MYPVAQVQEPYTAVGYLAQRIPVVNIMHLKYPDYLGNKPSRVDVEWSAMDICEGKASWQLFIFLVLRY